jgi:hypothetical protein
MRVAPSRLLLGLLAAVGVAALVALIAGVALPVVTTLTSAAIGVLLVGGVGDYVVSRRSWRAANMRFTRRLPAAFAIGVERTVRIALEHDDGSDWHCLLYDHVDPTVATRGLPVSKRPFTNIGKEYLCYWRCSKRRYVGS